MPRAGVGESAAFSTIVLRPDQGDIHLRIRHRKEVVVEGTWDSGEQVPTRDVARRHRMWSRGAGYSSRPGALEASEEWDGLAESENACYRFGVICPSGEQTDVSISASWGQVTKIIPFNDDLFVIMENRIAYLDGGVAPLVDLYGSSGDTFHGAVIWGDQLRVAIRCTHTDPNQHAFVSIAVGAPYTVINPTAASPAGTAMSASTPSLQKLAIVFWEYQGVAGWRMAGMAGSTFIQWTITNTGDPYDAANWGPEVSIGATAGLLSASLNSIVAMESSHTTLWVIKNDGVYAVRDATASAGGENLTPYWQQDVAPGGAYGMYFQDKLITYRGNRMEAIDVNSWQVQEKPTPIAIEMGRPNATALNSIFYTALGVDQGWLLAALKAVSSDSAYVLYGTPRPRESVVSGVTEYDWFAEIGPIANSHITSMCVHTPNDGTANGGRPSLWLGYHGTSTPTQGRLMKVDLFRGGSPLADTGHRYVTSSSVTFTDEHFASRAAKKGALRGELSVRNCGSGRSVALYAVAGAGSAFPGAATATVSTNVETSTFSLVNSGAYVNGSVIRSKAVLTSTATVPVVIDEWGMKANLGFPLRRRGTWMVELSDASEGDLPNFEALGGSVEAALKTLCETVEAFEVLDDEGNTITVVLENVLPWRREDVAYQDLGIRDKVRLLEVRWVQVA